ncbi:hypothetical protein MSAN_01537500 [Mycena sanguinolenta]|uniref:F-box domain-containing protein n=1 Tax=Mycena sanguinolenta TaxID=230812 RepID=A0A8H6Y7X3_9AGAR|nr:hypothetical protein MSAN_01537500 [Mycena sanguinolenta]
MTLLLSNLAPDVIFSVLVFCDISSVIAASQTCRYLHDLAFDKSVWLGLLDNLRHRSILDRTIELGTLSVAEMVKIVRRLITGPKTWSPLNIWVPSAEVFREITVHLRSEPGLGSSLTYKAQLLPSGHYVLFAAGSILECWNVAEDRLVWKYTSAIDSKSELVWVVDFAAQETDIESVIIMVCARTFPNQKAWVEIVNLNLRTGTRDVLLLARAPDFALSVPFLQPVILGALATVKMYIDTYMIIDWTAHLYMILRAPSDNTSQIALIPQHILLMTRSPSLTGQQIHLISIDALHALWTPTSSVDGPLKFSLISAEDIPKLSTFEHTDDGHSVHKMYVHDSPLQDGEYRVWIRGGTGYATEPTLSSYRLSIPTHGHPQWYQRNRLAVSGASDHAISYCGHALSSTLIREFSRQTEFFDLTQYSGALIRFTRSTIVIRYYK